MKAKYEIGQRVKLNGPDNMAGLTGTILRVDMEAHDVGGEYFYYLITLDEVYTSVFTGSEFSRVGRTELEISLVKETITKTFRKLAQDEKIEYGDFHSPNNGKTLFSLKSESSPGKTPADFNFSEGRTFWRVEE